MCNENENLVPGALKFFNVNVRELSVNFLVN